MKATISCFCVLISGGLALADTPTSSASADKPDYIYMESYTANDNSSLLQCDYFYDINGNEIRSSWDNRLSTMSGNWQSSSGGEASAFGIETSGSYPPPSSGTNTSWVYVIYDTNQVGTIVDASEDDIDSGFIINQEHCDLNVPVVDGTGSYTYPYDQNYLDSWHIDVVQFENSHAQATMKMKTGGRSGSKLQNVFGITASASRELCAKLPPPFNAPPPPPPPPIPQQNIVVGSLGNMPAAGPLYKVLPDDATFDVTPYVPGVDWFTFGVGETKYHSYFDINVEQPNPGYSFLPVADRKFGHAFWSLRTDLPGDALQHIASSLIACLGTRGFEPGTNGNYCSDDAGQLDDSAHAANIKRIFYIGYPGLINALEYVRSIQDTPPPYCWIDINCVRIAVNTGLSAGISMFPGDISPQNFGVMLIQEYPGYTTPWLPYDNEDIFYP